MLRGILFDFNGVLVDDEPIHLELFQRVLAEEGLALARERYYADYLGFDDRDCFAAVLAAAGREATEQGVRALIARKARLYEERIEHDGIPFFAGAVELLAAASEADLALGIVSGALRGEIDAAMRRAGVGGRLLAVVAAEDVTRGKPDPEGYRVGFARLATARAGLAPSEVLAIEDSPAGLAAARGAGLRTLGVAQTYRREELTGAERTVESLGEVDLARLSSWFAAR